MAFLVAPVLVQLMVWLEPGDAWELDWLSLSLVPLAVDELGQVWAVIFTLVAIGGGVFAQLGPRRRQPAYCAMSDVALRAVTSLSNSSRIAAGSSPNSMFVPPVSRKRAFAEPW